MAKHLKRFLVILSLSWLVGAGVVTVYLHQYSVEDFTIPDLIPIHLMLGFVGLLISAAGSMPLLLFMRQRVTGAKATFLLPAANALAVTAVVATATGLRALVLNSLPIVEAVLFTGAFFALSSTFGVVFVALYREGRRRRWVPVFGYLSWVLLLAVAVPYGIPFADEALQARAENGTVVPAAALTTPRSGHTATLLPDGRVLLIGGMVSARGQEIPTATTELFDPLTGTTSPGPDMVVPRAGHTATLLDNGDVLVTGGIDEKAPVASAELYLAVDRVFLLVGSMVVSRERHAASRLPNGKVLITGATVARPDATAELYDPTTRTFRVTGSMHFRRAAHTSTALADGRVLIAGGAESLTSVLPSLEIYDPARDSFTDAGQMRASRYKHSAVRLGDGMVLLVGGSDHRDWSGRRQSVELYDPVAGRCEPVGSLQRARFKLPGAVALAKSGQVVVAGSGRRVEVYDRAADRFGVSAGGLGDEWFYATATPLADGRVFIAGGYNSSLTPTNRSWIYQPADVSRRPEQRAAANVRRSPNRYRASFVNRRTA